MNRSENSRTLDLRSAFGVRWLGISTPIPAMKPITIPVVIDSSQDLPAAVGEACTGCGKCCINASYMGSMVATAEDMQRWREEEREDILQYAIQLPHMESADLWIHPVSGAELTRCPFVRKSGPRYICKIHDTRPAVCRGHPYGHAQMIDIGCEIPVTIKRVDS